MSRCEAIVWASCFGLPESRVLVRGQPALPATFRFRQEFPQHENQEQARNGHAVECPVPAQEARGFRGDQEADGCPDELAADDQAVGARPFGGGKEVAGQRCDARPSGCGDGPQEEAADEQPGEGTGETARDHCRRPHRDDNDQHPSAAQPVGHDAGREGHHRPGEGNDRQQGPELGVAERQGMLERTGNC